MSFLTEYFDEYRELPINRTKPFRPEARWAELEGKWMDPKKGTQDRVWTDEETDAFIKKTMLRLRGQSGYFNDYCEHLDQKFKTREFEPRPKKRGAVAVAAAKQVEEEAAPLPAKLAMKDTELMRSARELYERDMNQPTLEPLKTHLRIYGYVRPSLWKTGLSEYQYDIAQMAYLMIRDNLIPKYVAHNGERPKWGFPPEGKRQPELDGIPFESERLF